MQAQMALPLPRGSFVWQHVDEPLYAKHDGGSSASEGRGSSSLRRTPHLASASSPSAGG
jgi:hypothetical protein